MVRSLRAQGSVRVGLTATRGWPSATAVNCSSRHYSARLLWSSGVGLPGTSKPGGQHADLLRRKEGRISTWLVAKRFAGPQNLHRVDAKPRRLEHEELAGNRAEGQRFAAPRDASRRASSCVTF
jgi:hypothetical protein